MPERKTPPAERLAERAAELNQARNGVDQAFGGTQTDVTGELNTVDQHPADTSDFMHQRELQDTVESILDREAEQIREAQRRVETGEYGTCADCGEPIPAERLAVRPEATLCVPCQTRLESNRRGG